MSIENDKLNSPISSLQMDKQDYSLRPKTLSEFIGQKKVCNNIKIFIEAAKKRNEALDHLLLYGPPGLGKTTLAKIIANELGVNFKSTSGPVIQRPGDLAALLTGLEKHDILFIDEIHRLNTTTEEKLYPAMEDLHFDMLIGEGPSARSVKLDLQPFTLIGATTRAGLLSNPFRDRFGIPARLDFYEIIEMKEIVIRNSNLLGLNLDDKAAIEIAKRSRGTPRVAGRLVRRLRDIFTSNNTEKGTITDSMADEALLQLGVDKNGLDQIDQDYLKHLIYDHSGGPVGLETLAAQMGEQKDSIEDIIEPYLIQKGFLQKTPRGRVATKTAINKQKINKISIFPYINNVRIYYEDTDAGGVVYHSNYLKFAERARTEMLRKMNIHQQKLKYDFNIQFIVKKLSIEYNIPSMLDDLIRIESYILKVAAAKIMMKQIMYRKKDLIAKIDLTLGSINSLGKPVRLPTKILNKLKYNKNT